MRPDNVRKTIDCRNLIFIDASPGAEKNKKITARGTNSKKLGFVMMEIPQKNPARTSMLFWYCFDRCWVFEEIKNRSVNKLNSKTNTDGSNVDSNIIRLP